MSEFVDEDLTGTRFERVELRGATFREVDLTDAASTTSTFPAR